jgi:TolB protein
VNKSWLLLSLAIAGGVVAQDSAHLDNLKQLTFGGQNAEAYWAPDGKRLIFQSTRDKLECDQIFIMNADGSDQHMVSTGKGRTTCAYFLKDNKHILYASTHEAGDACPPSADRSKGYVWAVYPSYDIFLAADDGKIAQKLTNANGYDAEATVNWKTAKVVYTSMQSGDLERSKSPEAKDTMAGLYFRATAERSPGGRIIPARRTP